MWYQIKESHVFLSIKVKPNAKHSAILNVQDGNLQITLHASPRENEANLALTALLAKTFQLPKSQIEIIRGKKSRIKLVKLPYSDLLQTFIEKTQ